MAGSGPPRGAGGGGTAHCPLAMPTPTRSCVTLSPQPGTLLPLQAPPASGSTRAGGRGSALRATRTQTSSGGSQGRRGSLDSQASECDCGHSHGQDARVGSLGQPHATRPWELPAPAGGAPLGNRLVRRRDQPERPAQPGWGRSGRARHRVAQVLGAQPSRLLPDGTQGTPPFPSLLHDERHMRDPHRFPEKEMENP